jgi:hypothetical protein
MHSFVWYEWPQFFRGRFRVLDKLTGEAISAAVAAALEPEQASSNSVLL